MKAMTFDKSFAEKKDTFANLIANLSRMVLTTSERLFYIKLLTRGFRSTPIYIGYLCVLPSVCFPVCITWCLLLYVCGFYRLTHPFMHKAKIALPCSVDAFFLLSTHQQLHLRIQRPFAEKNTETETEAQVASQDQRSHHSHTKCRSTIRRPVPTIAIIINIIWSMFTCVIVCHFTQDVQPKGSSRALRD